MAALIGCGLFSLLTTVSIIGILIWESSHFFFDAGDESVETVGLFTEFLGGLTWNPMMGAEPVFGIWPLITGTFKIVGVAMAFALPLGLIVGVWLSEYAVLKPVLEILAGIPTVVFGFFALTFITPLFKTLADAVLNPAMAWGTAWLVNPVLPGADVRPWVLEFGGFNALSAGLAVGIMCLPIVTSLSEDAIRAVPGNLREGAYGLGGSRFETSVRVILPAALSGIVAAFLLAIARAVGETMIVALAAGSAPDRLLTEDGGFNPAGLFAVNEATQTMTGYMVQIFTGDAAYGTVEYYSSYAVAATLFVITLGITVLGTWIRTRFRQVYS